MVRHARSIALCLALTCSASAFADGVRAAELVARVTYGHGTNADEPNAALLELAPDVTFELSDTLAARLSLRVRGEERDLLLPGEPRVDSYDHATRPYAIDDVWLAELRDAYVDVRLDSGLFRIGKQQLVWGALDGIKVLDTLNPQSFEQFILEDFDASRIGLWSAYADVTAGSWRLEAALIPDATTHYVPEPGAWFELTAPRFRFGQDDPQASVSVLYGEPEDRRGTAALRVSRYVAGLDLQLVAASGLEFEPLGRITQREGQPAVETYHERRSLFGIGLAGSFAAFAFRGELAYSPKRVFNTRDGNELADETLAHWRAGVGVDWNAPLGLFVNVQYLHDTVVDAPDTLVRPGSDRLATAFVRRRFLYDTLNVEARWYAGLTESDRLVRFLASYDLSDRSTLRFSLDDFSGSADGVFGQFDQRDQFTLTLEHTF